MKKKNPLDEAITKGYLEDKLFELENHIEKRLDGRLDKKINGALQDQTNSIMNKLDEIVSEIENMREDKVVGAYQTAELRKDVDKHEKRIAKLEHSQKAA